MLTNNLDHVVLFNIIPIKKYNSFRKFYKYHK